MGDLESRGKVTHSAIQLSSCNSTDVLPPAYLADFLSHLSVWHQNEKLVWILVLKLSWGLNVTWFILIFLLKQLWAPSAFRFCHSWTLLSFLGLHQIREGFPVIWKARGFGYVVCRGLTNIPPPKPLGSFGIQHFSTAPTSSWALRVFGSSEAQFYSFSSLDTQLIFPGVLCFPRAKPGSHPFLGPWPAPAPRPGEALVLGNTTTPHHGLFLKDILLLSSNSIFPLGFRLLENKSQDLLQLGLTSAILRQWGTEAWREGENYRKREGKQTNIKTSEHCY